MGLPGMAALKEDRRLALLNSIEAGILLGGKALKEY
jgi:hypothetical protein